MTAPKKTDVGQCLTCGKVSYPTRKRAKEVAKNLFPASHLSPYRCGNYWHIGNLPVSVIRGVATRDTLRPAKKRPPLKVKWIP